MLTLTGTNFIPGGRLEFIYTGNVVDSASLDISDNIWTTKVPYISTLTSGSNALTIRIITAGGTSGSLPFTYSTAPTIANYTQSGAVGDLIAINGTNLNSHVYQIARITIGGIPVTDVTSAYGAISGRVPAGDGAENIQVTAYGGTVLAPGPFTYT